MKNYIFLLLLALLLTPHAGFSQTYKPLLKDSTTWYVSADVKSDTGELLLTETAIIVTAGDTQINGLNYTIISDTNYLKATPFPTDFRRFFREDISTGRVYMVSPSLGSNDEYLVYDFSLQAGDSISLRYIRGLENPATTWFKVDSVFMIETKGGQRKAWWLSNPDYALHEPIYNKKGILWVEELGASMGPFYYEDRHYDVNTRTYLFPRLLCTYKGESHEYALLEDTCYQYYRWNSIGKSSESAEAPFSAFYSYPDQLVIMLNSQNIRLQSISVYDAQGRVIHTEKAATLSVHQQSLNMQIKPLQTGIYFLSLTYSGTDQTMQQYTVKLFVE